MFLRESACGEPKVKNHFSRVHLLLKWNLTTYTKKCFFFTIFLAISLNLTIATMAFAANFLEFSVICSVLACEVEEDETRQFIIFNFHHQTNEYANTLFFTAAPKNRCLSTQSNASSHT